jgi:Fe-S-cluster containining protein
MHAHNVLCNSYNIRPLLCTRITCYVTVITHVHCYARAKRVMKEIEYIFASMPVDAVLFNSYYVTAITHASCYARA